MWGHGKIKKKLHYFSYKASYAPLHSGGLGIRDLLTFNIALVRESSRQLWIENVNVDDYLKNGYSLWAFHMAKKYFHDGDFMQAKVTSAHSKIWKFVAC